MAAQRSADPASIVTGRTVRLAVSLIVVAFAGLCGCAGTSASNTVTTVTVTVTARAPELGVATAPGGAEAQVKPAKYVYKVLGNYRATQLHYTASNGDMFTLNDTGNINTAGSALPWSGEATPEPNGNPNVLSASTLSAKGDSYITCIIEDDKGNIVASETGRGAYASCYASTPR